MKFYITLLSHDVSHPNLRLSSIWSSCVIQCCSKRHLYVFFYCFDSCKTKNISTMVNKLPVRNLQAESECRTHFYHFHFNLQFVFLLHQHVLARSHDAVSNCILIAILFKSNLKICKMYWSLLSINLKGSLSK